MSSISKLFPVGRSGTSVSDAGFTEKMTSPPSRYTEKTLLADMKNAAKFLPKGPMRDILKESDGIGTPATKAAIIEGLKSDGYIQTKGKQIFSTDHGKALIEILPKEFCDPGTTAVMEYDLRKISKGELDMNQFINREKEQIAKWVNQAKNLDFSKSKLPKRDGAPLEEKPCASIGCLDKGTITKRKGKFGIYWSCSFSKDGCNNKIKCKKDEVPFLYDPQDEDEIEPIPGHFSSCQKCKSGKLHTKVVRNESSKAYGKSFLSCDNKSCNAMVWPESSEPSNSPPVTQIEGHGSKCDKCGKGSLVTRVVKNTESKAFGKSFLACSNSTCKNLKWPAETSSQARPGTQATRDELEPLEGNGTTCKVCQQHPLVTKKVYNKESKYFGQRFLVCKEGCKNSMIFESSIPAGAKTPQKLVPDTSDPYRLAGTGKPCYVCGSPMATIKVGKENLKKAGTRYLKCCNPLCTVILDQTQAEKRY